MYLHRISKHICCFSIVIAQLGIAMDQSLADQFIHKLLPEIRKAETSLQTERQWLLNTESIWRTKHTLSVKKRIKIAALAQKYRLKNWQITQVQNWTALKARVDVWPTSLTIAQAAVESGWGQSRFAKQAHNFFGLWCYKPGCGLVPKNRAPHLQHEVQKFPSTQACIQHYYWTLNTHASYRKLRAFRAELRAHHQHLSAMNLNVGLAHYSALGQRYGTMLMHIIKQHHLQQLDTP